MKRHDGSKWFSVRMVLQSIHPDEPDARESFEERVVLFRAQNEGDVQEKLAKYRETSREQYLNAFERRVVRELLEVLDIEELLVEEIGDGTEVYYRFLDREGLEHLHRSSVIGA